MKLVVVCGGLELRDDVKDSISRLQERNVQRGGERGQCGIGSVVQKI